MHACPTLTRVWLMAVLMFCSPLGGCDHAPPAEQIESPEAAATVGSITHMTEIANSLDYCQSVAARYPSAGGSAEERPGLSWRVYVLRYLGEQALFEQFNLAEPWDSEHNLPLIEQMPSIYHSPMAPDTENGYTHFQLIIGEGTAFIGGRGSRLSAIQDGIQNTLMLVEADTPVIWTKPDDWEFDPEDPFHDLGGLHSGNAFLVSFFNCHSRFVSTSTDPEVFKAFITNKGGEQLDHDGLLER